MDLLEYLKKVNHAEYDIKSVQIPESSIPFTVSVGIPATMIAYGDHVIFKDNGGAWQHAIYASEKGPEASKQSKVIFIKDKNIVESTVGEWAGDKYMHRIRYGEGQNKDPQAVQHALQCKTSCEQEGCSLRSHWLTDNSASFIIFCKMLAENDQFLFKEYMEDKLQFAKMLVA